MGELLAGPSKSAGTWIRPIRRSLNQASLRLLRESANEPI